MRLMRPAVSSTAAWLPGAASLHSNCMTLPLLQPTSACTLFLSQRVLLSASSLREPAQFYQGSLVPWSVSPQSLSEFSRLTHARL